MADSLTMKTLPKRDDFSSAAAQNATAGKGNDKNASGSELFEAFNHLE